MTMVILAATTQNEALLFGGCLALYERAASYDLSLWTGIGPETR